MKRISIYVPTEVVEKLRNLRERKVFRRGYVNLFLNQKLLELLDTHQLRESAKNNKIGAKSKTEVGEGTVVVSDKDSLLLLNGGGSGGS
jgi:hypothetical protein